VADDPGAIVIGEVDGEAGPSPETAAETRHQELVAAINRMVEDAEQHTKKHVEEYRELKRLYRGQPESRDVREGRSEPGKIRASVANLEMFRCVESVSTGESAVLFTDDPNWEPYDPDLTDQATAGMYHIRQLVERGHEQMDLQTAILSALRSKNLYGKVVVEVGWKQVWRWRPVETPPVMDPMTGAMTGGGVEWQEVLDEQHPFMAVIPPWRWVQDPNAERIADASWVAVKRHLSREQLDERMAYARQQGMTVREIGELRPREEGTTAGEATNTVSTAIQRAVGVDPEQRKGYDCVEVWGRHPTATRPDDPAGKKPDRRIYTCLVVEGQVAAIEGLNYYRHGRVPFLDCIPIPEEETAEGLGAGHLLKTSQVLVNDTESKLQEMLNYGTYGVWQRRGALTNRMKRQVRVFPGRIFDDTLDGVVDRLPFDVAPFKLGQTINGMRIEGMRAASGATTNLQGMPSGSNLATEIRTIAAEAARRLTESAKAFANQIYRPFLAIELELYDQFLPEDEEIRTEVPVTEDMAAGMGGTAGRTMTVGIEKAALRLSKTRVRLKLAIDLDGRKNMTRNLNQVMAQQASLIEAVAKVAPAAAGAAIEGLLPGIFQLQKKQLAINGINPETVPAELVREIQAIIRQEREAAMIAGQQQAALAQGAQGVQGVPAMA